ncbi:MAG: N-acetylmuramoyl-L-alanine amidase family protein [Acidobacteriaceae bacterium]
MPLTEKQRRAVPLFRAGFAALCLLAAAFTTGLLPLVHPVSAAQAPAAIPQPTPPAPQAATVPVPAPATKQFVIVLDPAHGGADTGAQFSDQILEKNIVLSLSYRIRSLLVARGFSVVTTRNSDTGNLPTDDQHAEIANHADAMACLLLHATPTGNGIHLFNSSLAAANTAQTSSSRNSFLPWDTAQAAYIQQSLLLSGELNSAFGRAGIPVTLGRTFLRPLDNLTCPAVAVEVAPLAASGDTGAAYPVDPAYQQRVAQSIAWALVDWRAHTTGGRP